jgi:putative hemolysin
LDEPPIGGVLVGIAFAVLAGLLGGGLKAISVLAREQSEEWIVGDEARPSPLQFWLRRPIHLQLTGQLTLLILISGAILGVRSAAEGRWGLPPAAAWAIALVVSSLLVFLAQVGGQLLGLRFPGPFARATAAFLFVPSSVTWPVLYPISRLLSRGGEGPSIRLASEFIPFPRIHKALESQEAEGGLEEGEREMITSIMDFGETLVREIMVPRIDIVAFEASLPLPEIYALVNRAGFSRIPVYEDRIDNIIGILYVKDLLKTVGRDEPPQVRNLLRPSYFVPESKKIDDLLTEFQQEKTHMAIVVDEYGGTSGVVTLEDVLEEIVGEIHDEYDRVEKPYEFLNDDTVMVRAKMDLDDLNEALQIELPTDEYDTLGGFLYHQAEKIPDPGESIRYGDLEFTVQQVKGQRITMVTLRSPGLRRRVRARAE